MLAASLALRYTAQVSTSSLQIFNIFLEVRIHSHVNWSGRGVWVCERQFIIQFIKLYEFRSTKEQFRLPRGANADK